MKNNTTVTLRIENPSRSVHVNCVRPLLEEDTTHCVPSDKAPPLFSYGPAPLPCSQEVPDPGTLASSSGTSGVPYVTKSGRVMRPVQHNGDLMS